MRLLCLRIYSGGWRLGLRGLTKCGEGFSALTLCREAAKGSKLPRPASTAIVLLRDMALSLAKSWRSQLTVVLPIIKRSFATEQGSTKRITSRIPLPTGDQLHSLWRFRHANTTSFRQDKDTPRLS